MNKFQYIFLVNDIAFDEGKCNNLFFKRPVKAMWSIMVYNMVWNQVQYFKGLKVYNVPKICGGATSFLQSPFFCDEWRSHFVMHDAPINVTYASVLLLLVPPSSICCFPLIAGAKSLVTISGLEVQVQVYTNIDKDMLYSFDTETIHGTQRASFASTSEQPPQCISYALTFFAWPNSVFQCSSNVFFAKLEHVRPV